MGKLKNVLKQLKEDYMKTPKPIKRLLQSVASIAFLAVLVLFLMVISGCSYGPSKAFVFKMDERAEKHFPRYIHLIETSNKAQLEHILGHPPGTFKDALESDIKPLKDSQVNAVNAWWFEIKQNRKLLHKEKGEEDDE